MGFSTKVGEQPNWDSTYFSGCEFFFAIRLYNRNDSHLGMSDLHWNANTAELLMECEDNTEIAVHDANLRVASFMYYEGGANNRITIGRDMGWNGISSVNIPVGLC